MNCNIRQNAGNDNRFSLPADGKAFLFAFLHPPAAFVLVAALVAELMLLQPELTPAAAPHADHHRL